MKLVVTVLLVGAFAGRGAAQEAASRPWDRFEAAHARGDRAAAFAAGAAALRADCARAPAGLAEADVAAGFVRLRPYAAATPGEWLDVLNGLSVAGALEVMVGVERCQAFLQLGRPDDAAAEARRLGFVGQWLLAGPFDNERGAGFRGPLEPERGPVRPDATFDGKDRKTGWRFVAAETPNGRRDLGDFCTPREQVLVYLAATLTTDAPVALALGVGSTGAYEAFLDGRSIARRVVAREAAVDQEFVPLDLAAGTRELLVKIGVEQGAFVACLRLASADGGPPPKGVLVSAAPEAFGRTPRPATASAPSSDRAAIGFLAAAEAAAADPAADARARARAAPLRRGLRVDDFARPETPALTERLLKAAPDDVRARELRALSLRRTTRIAAERADNTRLAALESVLEADPRHVPTLVEFARTALEELHQPAEAAARVARALEANPAAPEALGLRARIAESSGRAADAERDLRAAAAAGGVAERLVLARRLASKGRRREADAALAEAAALAPGDRSTLELKGGRAQAAGDLDGAVAAGRAITAAFPTDVAARLRLAGLHEARQDYRGALAELGVILAFDPDRPEALARAATNADRLGKSEEALEFVRRALEITPGDPRLRRYEGRLAGGEQAFEDAYPVDVAALAAAAPDPAVNPENRSHRVLASRRIFKAAADGTVSDFRQYVVQVLSQAGVERFDRVRVRFTGGEQRARIKSARLLRPGAAPVEAEREGSWGADFPPLRVGDVVEWSSRIDDLRPGFFGNYVGLRHAFHEDVFTETTTSELVLLLPTTRDFRVRLRNLAVEPEPVAPPPWLKDYAGTRYVAKGLAAVVDEPAAPPAEEFSPELQLSTYADWDAFATWWWSLIKDQADVDDAMRAKVAELVRGRTTDEEKIRALYAFVVSDVRYVAWEFGVHGYKPYRSSAVFERRFGDCKDKALLFGALLREAGLVAYPTLVRAETSRPEEDHSLALVEHFNHCIAAVPTPDGGFRFFDGTAEFHAAGEIPDSDRGAKVVVVKEGRAVAASVPHATPDDNAEIERLSLDLRADGSATATFEASLRGRYAAAARATFVNEADRKDVLGRLVNARLGPGALVAVGGSRLEDLAEPARTGWTFEIKEAVVRDGAKARLKPLWPAFDWTALVAAPTRRFDLLLGEASRTETTATIRLPAGAVVAEVPRDVVLKTPFADYALERETRDGALLLRRRLDVKAARVRAGDYEAFKAFVVAAAAADAETATFEGLR